MKRSLGSRGVGGRSGGGMLKAVGRAVGAGVGGVRDVFSSPTPRPTTTVLSISSSSPSSSSTVTVPVSAASTWSSLPAVRDLDDWEFFQAEEEEEADVLDPDGNVQAFESFGFGPVPSQGEVEEAVSALRQVAASAAYSQLSLGRSPSASSQNGSFRTISPTESMRHGASSGSESDWTEPAMHLYNLRTLQTDGYNNVIDAFRLLQINPSVQRMVVSLSSDKAVWDAVMRNEAVRELQESLSGVENEEPQVSEENSAATLLKWIVNTTKEKMSEFISKIINLVNDLVQPSEEKRTGDSFDNTLRSSFMLSVMVLLVVVVARIQRA